MGVSPFHKIPMSPVGAGFKPALFLYVTLCAAEESRNRESPNSILLPFPLHHSPAVTKPLNSTPTLPYLPSCNDPQRSCPHPRSPFPHPRESGGPLFPPLPSWRPLNNRHSGESRNPEMRDLAMTRAGQRHNLNLFRQLRKGLRPGRGLEPAPYLIRG